MALRTINNALATLRNAKIVLPREVAEKQGEVTEKVTEKSGEVTEKVTEKSDEYTEKYTEKQTEKGSEYTENSAESAGNLTETEERIVAILRQNKFVTQGGISDKLGITRTYITKIMGGLQARNIIRRVGPDKGGYWEVSRMVNSILKKRRRGQTPRQFARQFARQFGPKMWYNTHQSFQMEVKNGIYGRAGSLYWQNRVRFALGYASY